MTKCEKCGHESEKNLKKFGLSLCEVCIAFAPNNPEKLDDYISEKISPDAVKELDKFRKYSKPRGEIQKIGMLKKSSEGKHVSRIPFGYEWDLKNKSLIPAQNFREVEEMFEEYSASDDVSLRQVAKKHNLSVNGLKKILRNFAYIGKVKFDGQIHEGKHKAILSTTLFNKVQDKLDKLKNKKNSN